jgi:hypothetical protein
LAPRQLARRTATDTTGRYRADSTHSVEQQDRQARQLSAEPRAAPWRQRQPLKHHRPHNKVDNATPVNDAPNSMICMHGLPYTYYFGRHSYSALGATPRQESGYVL